jgi:outer membrane protein assembly factor BamE (lipoprotein component of BamABCDE complex)
MRRRSLIRRPANWWAWFLMAAWGAMTLSGCLGIPVDYYANYSRHNISDKTQSQLQPGVTTKEEVFLLLGEPDYASYDGQSIGYGWTRVKAVYAVLGQFTADAGEIKRSYVLQIKFDSNNRVVGVDVTKEWIRFW